MTIGEKIREIRIKSGITQKQLAEKLNTSQQNLAQYENGKRKPKIETLEKISSALDIPLYELTDIQTAIIDGYVFTGTPETVKEFRLASKFINSKRGKILQHFKKLNDAGQEKALEQIEMLTKIPEYQKK